MEEQQQIYVACLASYNNGFLYGKWINANQEPQAIYAEIYEMLEGSPVDEVAEEWAIHDYDNFDGLRLGEYESIEHICEIAKGLQEHGSLFSVIYKNVQDINEATRIIEDNYIGAYDSEREHASEHLHELYPDLFKNFYHYLDFDLVTQDLKHDFSYFEDGDKVHVFIA